MNARRAGIVAIWFGVAVCWTAPALAANPNGIAVIIGNRDYSGDIPNVTYAHNDAEALRRFVIDVLEYREGNVVDLRDATLGQMLSWFGAGGESRGRLADWVRPGESDVLVFYSGHGVPGIRDGRGYLLPVDGDPNRPDITGYSVDLLQQKLAQIGARSVTIYLDACFSGVSHGGALLNVSGTFRVTLREVPAMTVLTAAARDQVASWDAEAGLGLFTRHLLMALHGAADAEGFGNRDGVATADEVKRYLDSEMTYQARRLYSRDQTATLLGDGAAVLAVVPEPAAADVNPNLPPAGVSEAVPPLQGPDPAMVFGDTNTDVRVVIRALEDSWVQVTGAGGELLYTRIMRAGDEYRLPNRDDLVLMTGNAGALEITVDGTLVPSIGPIGTVRANIPLAPDRLLAGIAVNR